jgi:simple sugar transport system substrate-binding protein
MLGPQLMQLAKDVFAGKPVAKRITTEEGVFTADVAAKELPKRKY